MKTSGNCSANSLKPNASLWVSPDAHPVLNPTLSSQLCPPSPPRLGAGQASRVTQVSARLSPAASDYSCALQREILLQGRLYLSENWICFYSNIFRWETTVSWRGDEEGPPGRQGPSPF